MSEISEIEIKSMTKEQNYIRGYKNGKSDVLDKIRAEIQSEQNDILWRYNDYDDGRSEALEWVLEIIDKYSGVRE